MKVSSCLFALFAFGALSTEAAMARHYGHHAHSRATAGRFGSHGLATNSTAASKDFGSKLQTGTADHATAGTDSPKPNGSDKRIGDDLGSHTKKSAKGVSDKTDPDAERTTVHGLHHTATRGSSSSGNEGSADHPIDLRITVHQGREIGKSVKERLFRKPKTALATGTGLNQQHSRDQQSARALHRNAIGAIVGTEKTIKHDFATVGPAAAPVAVTAAVPAIGSAPQATGAPPPIRKWSLARPRRTVRALLQLRMAIEQPTTQPS